MDRRDVVRIGRAESPGPTESDVAPDDMGPPRVVSSRRFARLVEHPAARRLAVSKLGRAVIGLAIVVALIVIGGSTLSKSVVTWLHRRPEYQTSFAVIELDPPPPPWIKGGRSLLLESIRAGRDSLLSFSALDLDLDALLADFRLNPWILRADRAETHHPNRIVVRLVYREPVAIVVLLDNTRYTIDAEGVVLSRGEIDFLRSGPLLEIHATNPPEEPKPGLSWPTSASERRAGRGDRVAVAARLAGFLKTKSDRLPKPPATQPDRRTRMFTNHGRELWVVFPDETMVCWTRFDSSVDPTEPSDAEKWDRLEVRAASPRGLRSAFPRGFFDFESGGIRDNQPGKGGS